MKTHSSCQLWIIALVLTSICVYKVHSQGNQYKRVCYFTNWSKYRRGNAKFTAEKIDPFLCTHLIFAFGDFDHQGNLRKLEDWHDSKDYEHFRNLKQRNPELRTLLAIGGWNFGSTKYSNMAANPHIRKTFVSSAVSFLRNNGFDGLDIDWEYPAERGGIAEDKQNLVTLCKELKNAFITEGQQNGIEALLLSAAVPASRYKADVGYDIPSLNNYFDFINIMTYDFHGGWEDKVGQNSPLFPSPIEEGDNFYLNIRESANYWSKAGIPKHKLVIGLAAYGRSFRLKTGSYGLGAPASKGPAGPFTREAGFWSYYEICMEIDNDFRGEKRGTVYYDTDQEVPFYVKDNLWVGYDNERSIKAKTRWIKENFYGGIMVWSLALDDFNQMCPYSKKPYPLLHAAIEELGVPLITAPPVPLKLVLPTVSDIAPFSRRVEPTAVAPAKVTIRIETPIEPAVPAVAPIQTFECPPSGHHYFPDMTNCQKYLECTEGHMYPRDCPSGLHWDEFRHACNWKHEAGCQAQ